MENQITLQETNIPAQIHYATSVVGLSLNEIKEKFSSYPVCVCDLYENGEDSFYYTEVWLDGEQTILTCSLSPDGICKSVLLYLKQLHALADCVNFLNAKYTYDYVESVWVLPDYCLSLEKTVDEVAIVFRAK